MNKLNKKSLQFTCRLLKFRTERRVFYLRFLRMSKIRPARNIVPGMTP
jgi:hypothetical protein